MKMKKGFTLAEVLITLGIIGVVAAMTIPTLIQNYREREFESKIKKTYSTLAQAFQELIRRQNALYISDTTFIDHPVQALSTVMAITTTQGISYALSDGAQIDNNNGPYLQMADGTLLSIDTPKSSNSRSEIVTQLVVDTNGEKAPNAYGRDVFVFYLRNDGRVIAGTQSGSFRSFGNGAAETQRIMQRGWQIGD